MTAKLDLRIEVDPQGRRQLTHPEAASISHQTLIERARALVPVLRERAARTEAAERLLPETVTISWMLDSSASCNHDDLVASSSV
jgi:hypothetical protein